jgi:peptidoglycan DL-endopeptidase CwlO
MFASRSAGKDEVIAHRPATPRIGWVVAAAGLSVAALLAPVGSALAASTAATQTTRPAATSSASVDQAANEHDQAVFDLLVLERKLATTERRLAEAESERERLAARLATAVADRDRTQRDLTTTRTRLTFRLRAMYITGDLGWLDYLAGSADLRQLVDRAGLLSRVVVAEARLAEQIDRARAGAVQAETSLRQAAAAQASLVSEARALRGHLEQARTDQARLAARLGDRLARVQADARAAQARMDAINRQAGGGSLANAGGGASTGGTGPSTGDTGASAEAGTGTTIGSTTPRTGRQLTVQATAYALPGTTATGVGVRYGIIAVDPRVIPLGTRLYVPGYGEGIAADTGGAVKGNSIDVWLPSETQAEEWGVKTITITILD